MDDRWITIVVHLISTMIIYAVISDVLEVYATLQPWLVVGYAT